MPLLLFLFALGLGVVAAIPIGACQVEMAKRAIHGKIAAALMVVLGSVSSDVIYGAVALFGIAPILEIPAVMALLSGAAALVLWGLAYLTWRDSRRPRDVLQDSPSLKSRRWAYATGFVLGMGNPPAIVGWLFGIALAKRFGLVASPTPVAKASFIAGAALGLAAYMSALTVVSFRVRHFLSPRAVGRLYFWLAILLLVFSVYFLHGVYDFLVHAR